MTEYMRVQVTVEQTRETIIDYDVDAEEYRSWLNGYEHSAETLLEFLTGGRDYPGNLAELLPDLWWKWDVIYNTITGVEA